MKSFFLIDDWGPAAYGQAARSIAAHVPEQENAAIPDHSRHRDAAVPYDQATLHVKLFKERGIPVELITVQDGVHGVMNWEKDPHFHTYKQPMIDWLKKTLK